VKLADFVAPPTNAEVTSAEVMSLGAPLAPSSNCVHQSRIREPQHPRRGQTPEDTRAGWCAAQSYLLQCTSHFVWTPSRHCRLGRNLIYRGTFWSGAAAIATGRAGKIREGIRDDHRD